MPSSISSFEPKTVTVAATQTRNLYLAWSVRTIAALVLFSIAIEALTRFGFSHLSRIEARVSSDDRAARAMHGSGKPGALLVGNSLLLEGIDYARLRDSLAPGAAVVRFPIEGTQYLDWYYGLRRLFEDGSQPHLVVLCLSAEHLISPRIRGDYSAFYLFRLADIPQIRREVDYDLTKTSSLVLARFSLFYAGRSSLRNFILVRTAPGYPELLQRLATGPPHFPPDEEIERIAESRLRALDSVCSSHGARFAFLLAPGFGPGEAPLVTAGARSHTDVMVPIHLNELSRDLFRDGFHLNAAGARIFTGKVSEVLKARLVQAQ